jgi:hypothetical protein
LIASLHFDGGGEPRVGAKEPGHGAQNIGAAGVAARVTDLGVRRKQVGRESDGDEKPGANESFHGFLKIDLCFDET